jgi:hypothetical protein
MPEPYDPFAKVRQEMELHVAKMAPQVLQLTVTEVMAVTSCLHRLAEDLLRQKLNAHFGVVERRLQELEDPAASWKIID